MNKPVILIDCDGVMADFVGSYMRVFKLLHGWCFLRDAHTTWEFKDSVCSAAEDRAVWEYFEDVGGVVESIDDMPGSCAGLEKLRALGRVVCVTSPKKGNYRWAGERAAWLAVRGFSEGDVVQANDKTLVPGDLLIDDAIHNLEAWRLKWGRPVICFAAPYNTGFLSGPAVGGWGELVTVAYTLLGRRI